MTTTLMPPRHPESRSEMLRTRHVVARHRRIPARRPTRLRLIRHSLALAKRSLIKTMRTPEQLLDVTVQPIIFVLLFVFLLGGAIAGSRHEYIQYLLPAIMVQTVMFASMATGVGLNMDMSKGVFDRFRSMPISRAAPLLGSVLGDLTRFAVAIVVLLGFGYVLGFRIGTNPVTALLGCLLVAAFASSLSWIFVLAGVVLRQPGAVQGVAFMTMFPLTFGTNMMVPTETLPGWLQVYVKINPVSEVMAMSRGMLVGGPVARPVLLTLMWSGLLVIVFLPLSVRAYRRRT